MADALRHHPRHAPTNQGSFAVPHGPETGGDHDSLPDRTPANEMQIFNQVLCPDDNYTKDGVYWADLPLKQKIAFVGGVDRREARKEWNATKDLARKSWFAPAGWYFKNCVLPGAGLGLEGYVLFSIGNVEPLFAAVWPECWESHEVCNKTWVQSVTYLEICGIIVGQVLVGIIGDAVGRRWGLIQDAVIMFLGLLLLIGAWGTSLEGWVICYTLALFFYGIGVGGEYPMTATAAMENATGSGRVSTKEDRLHRGRKVTMAFLMQGWGQFLNQVVLIVLMLIFHHGSGNPPYSVISGQSVFRVSFVPIAIGTAWLVYYRYAKMPLASKELNDSKKRSNVTGYDMKSLKLTFTHFGPRLIATAGSWYANDVFFYGNKLFQGQFIKVLSPGSHSVMTGWLWNLCNVGVSLVGYYLASMLIDNKLYGRKMMMQVGFAMDFILFIVPAFHYKYFTSLEGIHAFQAMYFLSSFFNQFGPNSVTFLVAAEVYPTPVRATAHGFSAAVGKLGALTAAVLYNYIDSQMRFYVVPWFGLVGMLVTFFFLPDTTGLDLKEQERWWAYIRAGRGDEYHGIAVHPNHLSLWERFRGMGKHYNPELDKINRIADLKEEWKLRESEKQSNEDGAVDEDHDSFPPHIHNYLKETHVVDTKIKGVTPYNAMAETISSEDMSEKKSSNVPSDGEKTEL